MKIDLGIHSGAGIMAGSSLMTAVGSGFNSAGGMAKGAKCIPLTVAL